MTEGPRAPPLGRVLIFHENNAVRHEAAALLGPFHDVIATGTLDDALSGSASQKPDVILVPTSAAASRLGAVSPGAQVLVLGERNGHGEGDGDGNGGGQGDALSAG